MGNSSADRSRGLGLVGLGTTLGLSIVASAAILGDTIRDVRSQDEIVEVKGYAEREIESDRASWAGSFATRAAALEQAYDELADQQARVMAFLEARGFPESEVVVSPVHTRVLYGMNEKGMSTNEIEGYELSLGVSVDSQDIDEVAALARESGELVRQGIRFSAGSPQYVYTRQDELKIAMLGEATADARRRAEVLAENSEASIGGLRSARQGVFQITPAHSTEVSDYGRNDTTTRLKSIKAVVTIRYALDR